MLLTQVAQSGSGLQGLSPRMKEHLGAAPTLANVLGLLSIGYRGRNRSAVPKNSDIREFRTFAHILAEIIEARPQNKRKLGIFGCLV